MFSQQQVQSAQKVSHQGSGVVTLQIDCSSSPITKPRGVREIPHIWQQGTPLSILTLTRNAAQPTLSCQREWKYDIALCAFPALQTNIALLFLCTTAQKMLNRHR